MPARKKPWYRPRNIMLALIVALCGLIGREVYLSLTATPGTSINYMDRARELVAAYQPPEAKGEPNAWPVLLEAIDRLGQAETASPKDESLAGAPIDLTAVFWTPDQVQYNDAYTWAQVKARALEIFENARQTGTFDAMAEIARAHRFERTLPVSGQMIGVLLPELGKMRQLARLGGARMAVARTAGDDAGFVDAYEQTLAVGRAAAHQAFLIDYLVGIAITSLGTSHLRQHLADAPFPEATLRALLEATDRQRLPPIDVALEGEKLSTLDTIQWTHTDDGRGSGRFIPSTLSAVGSLSAGTGTSGFLGTLSQLKILNLVGLAFPSKAATTRKTEAFYDGLMAFARAPVQERRALAFQPDSYVETLPRRYLLLRLLLPAIAKAVQSRDQAEMEIAATRLMLGIELYRARNGRYPETLEALVPSVLPALPVDPINGKGFGYRLLAPEAEMHPRPDGSSRPYLLYSFGVDGVDNGGKESDQNKVSVTRTPANHDYILNLPHAKAKKAGEGTKGEGTAGAGEEMKK